MSRSRDIAFSRPSSPFNQAKKRARGPSLPFPGSEALRGHLDAGGESSSTRLGYATSFEPRSITHFTESNLRSLPDARLLNFEAPLPYDPDIFTNYNDGRRALEIEVNMYPVMGEQQTSLESLQPLPQQPVPPAQVTLDHASIIAGRDSNVYAIGNLSVTKNITKESSTLLQKLYDMLKPINAAYDSYEADHRTRCFENTRRQLLDEISLWMDGFGTHTSIYVLDGVAGIGKSTVAQTVAERAALRGLLGASFFFTRNEEERTTAKHFFSTISFQLACYNESFALALWNSLQQNPGASGKVIHQQLSLLITKPLEIASLQAHSIIVVVDALDECREDEASNLLNLLAHCRTPQLKFFITSRPELHIRNVLEDADDHKLFHLHEIDKSIVQSDIQTFLEFSLSAKQVQKAFPHRKPPWQPSAKEMEMLCGMCGTLFIIASTIARFLLDSKGSGPGKRLALLFNGVSPADFSGSSRTDVMDRVYMQIILCAVPNDSEEFEDWIDRYQSVVGAITTLQTPLPCSVLGLLLRIDPNDIQEVLLHLHSLVAPSGSDTKFHIHHKTFPDFVSSDQRIRKALERSKAGHVQLSSKFLIDLHDHHCQLAHTCFQIMDEKLAAEVARINIRDWKKSSTRTSWLSQELVYSVMHWASHLLATRHLLNKVQKDLNTWAQKHVLKWLEGMCILGQIEHAHHVLKLALQAVEEYAQVGPEYKIIVEILHDASRCVLQSSVLLKQSPEYVHQSVLPFLPQGSQLYQIYAAADGVKVLGRMWENWGQNLAVMANTITTPSEFVHTIAFSPDGSQLASSTQRTVQLWDSKTGYSVASLTQSFKNVYAMAFSPDGIQFAVQSADNAVQLWNGKTNQCLATHYSHSRTMLFSPDGLILALVSHNSTVWLYDAKTGCSIANFTGHSGFVRTIAFSPDGLRLASDIYGTLQLWDQITGCSIAIRGGCSANVEAISFSPDGSRLASASKDNTIWLLNAKTGHSIATLKGHSGWVQTVAFSPDNLKLASGSNDGTVKLWNGRSGQHILSLKGHSGMVNAVAFSSDGSKLVSASGEIVRVWDGNTGLLISILEGHSDTITAIKFSPDDSKLASASWDRTVRLWDIKTNHLTPNLKGHSELVSMITFSLDGQRVASASWDNTVRLWDAKTGCSIAILNSHSDQVETIAFSPNGSVLASGSHDKTAKLWNGETGCHIATLEGHSGWIKAVAFSCEGSILASGSHDKTIKLWDGQNGHHIATLQGHSGWIETVIFSPIDTPTLASGSHDKAIKLWDGKTGLVLNSLEGHSDIVTTIAFSPDGLRLASGSRDKTVKLWNVNTGQSIASLCSHDDWIIAVAFSPDGTVLVSSSCGNDVQIWDGNTGIPILVPTDNPDPDSNPPSPSTPSCDEPTVVSASAAKNCKTQTIWNGTIDGSYLATIPEFKDKLDRIPSFSFLPYFPLHSSPLPSNQLTPRVSNCHHTTSEMNHLSMTLILPIEHQNLALSGVVCISLQPTKALITAPICWLPPHFSVTSFALHPKNSLIGLGCSNGEVLLLDISAVNLPI